MKKRFLIGIPMIVLPILAFAGSVENDINTIVSNIKTLIISPLVYLFFTLSFLVFIWGMAIFIFNSNEQTKRQEGKQHMIWGLIGLFIVSSTWGILNLIKATIGGLGS